MPKLLDKIKNKRLILVIPVILVLFSVIGYFYISSDYFEPAPTAISLDEAKSKAGLNEAKPLAEIEVKEEVKPEPQVEAKAEVKPEPQAEVKVEVKEEAVYLPPSSGNLATLTTLRAELEELKLKAQIAEEKEKLKKLENGNIPNTNIPAPSVFFSQDLLNDTKPAKADPLAQKVDELSKSLSELKKAEPNLGNSKLDIIAIEGFGNELVAKVRQGEKIIDVKIGSKLLGGKVTKISMVGVSVFINGKEELFRF